MTHSHGYVPARAKQNVPAYRDIYQRVRSEILSGRIAAHARLPSSRTLANQLGVARGTVEVAYQMLAGEGFTISEGARGTIVNPSLPREKRPVSFAAAAKQVFPEEQWPPAKPMLFQMGLPSLDAFPRKQWAQIAARIARKFDIDQLLHHHDVMGYRPLRQAIASYLRIARGISCTPDQILITAGFQGALGLIVQTLLKPDDTVWVEDPGYFMSRRLLLEAPVRLVGVTVDGEGLDVRAGTDLAPHAAMAVVTTTHQYPLATTLPIDRRLALLDWAEREKAWIVEDDYDCEFHHRGLPPPALKSLDRGGRVIYAGTFSKVLFPGLRLGYLVLPDSVSERFADVARVAHPIPPLMIQQMVEDFMSKGHFARHLSRMRGLYTERRSAVAAALTATMPHELDISLTDGGMYFVANLRGKARDLDVVLRLRGHGVGPSALSRCFFTAPSRNGLMIGYTNVAKEDAGAAAERMHAAMR